jgi:hypothetical protein
LVDRDDVEVAVVVHVGQGQRLRSDRPYDRHIEFVEWS